MKPEFGSRRQDRRSGEWGRPSYESSISFCAYCLLLKGETEHARTKKQLTLIDHDLCNAIPFHCGSQSCVHF